MSKLHLICENLTTEQSTARDVELCRICLATDGNLCSMKMDKSLGQAYRILTGLSIDNDDNIPPYLCTECSHQLIHCIHFRGRTLQTHVLLLEILKKHNCITLEIIKALNENQEIVVPSLDETSNLIEPYDLEVVHIKKENINPEEEVLLRNVSGSLEVLDGLKRGYDYIKQEKDSSDDDTVYSSSLHKDTLLNGLKTEVEANTESANVEYPTSDKKVFGDTILGEDGFEHSSQVERQEAKPSITKNEEKPTKGSEKNSDNSLLLYDNLCCDMCPYKTVSDVKFLKHLKAHATPKSCTRKCNYKTNIRQKEKCTIRFSCHVCNKIFSTNWGLQKHVKRHTGEKSYICDVCERGFTEKRDLQNHLRTHSGEKPFGCDLCKKSFSERGNLLRHIRIHAGEKPFKCKICKISFSLKHHLKRHMVRHKGK